MRNPSKRKNQPSVRFRVFRTLFLLCGLLAISTAVLLGSWLQEVGVFSISKADLNPIIRYRLADNSVIYDRNNKAIGAIFDKYQIKSKFDDLPKFLISAITAIEDRSFFKHQGIDVRGILRASLDRIKNGKIRQGASTITQQLVRHFLLQREKSFERKVREAALAIELEKWMTKEEILTLYSNVMYLGSRSYGVAAAAKRYFGRPLDSLRNHELALLAGLFQSPSRYNPHRHPKRAKKRQIKVLQSMYDSRMITAKQLKRYVSEPLEYVEYKQLSRTIAPYFIDHIQERSKKLLNKSIRNRGVRIYTTLDQEIHAMAKESIKERQDIINKAKNWVFIPYKHRNKNPSIQTSFLVTDPRTGEVLSMVGGLDYKKSNFNRTIQAKRQPGSAFKPIIYSLALSKGYKWSDITYVSPVKVQNYRPKNFSREYLTEATLLRSFFKSINTTAVELGTKLELSKVLKHAKKMGIETDLKEETGALLGASEVTMMDLARVYATIANEGVKVEPISILKITDKDGKIIYQAPSLAERSEKVLSRQDAYLMLQGLKAVFKVGTAYSENDLGQFAAGKTGTSNGSRDNWFCGFTRNLVAINWVGSDRAFEFMGKATGTSLALPIWSTFIRKAITKRPAENFRQPPGIILRKVHSKYGHKAPRGMKMYFKKGQEPEREESDLNILSERGGFRTIFEN